MSKTPLSVLLVIFAGATLCASGVPVPDYLVPKDSIDATMRAARPQTRGQTPSARDLAAQAMAQAMSQPSAITTKQEYIDYLKYKGDGTQKDCADKYQKYINFFEYDGDEKITAKVTANPTTSVAAGMIDTICDFQSYANWCFALGFAYAGPRPLSDTLRASQGRVCYTYNEFCVGKGKTLDPYKIDAYMLRIIDEIIYYYRNIRGTDKNTVLTTVEKTIGSTKTTTTAYQDYKTDDWIFQHIPESTMASMLCK